jgi:predicted nucleotidyltransferase component of viral defense system
VKDSRFFAQAGLMVRALPAVAAEACFALKGGTAINLFVRDLPRLSVDIDLTYVPVEPRAESLRRISQALLRVSQALKKAIARVQVSEVAGEGGHVVKLFVRDPGAQIKIEPNLNLRGTVFGVEERTLRAAAEQLFERSVSITTVSLADLYGGKICAALDRQHPRDLFDIKLLLENEGITNDIRRAFIVYLASHDRPMSELIDPTRLDVRRAFDDHFVGMTTGSIAYQDLDEARERLIVTLLASLTDAERRFLVSLKEGKPNWALLAIPGADALPGVRWKLQNIAKMDPDKHRIALDALRSKLGL